jgi:hypothetical protein
LNLILNSTDLSLCATSRLHDDSDPVNIMKHAPCDLQEMEQVGEEEEEDGTGWTQEEEEEEEAQQAEEGPDIQQADEGKKTPV